MSENYTRDEENSSALRNPKYAKREGEDQYEYGLRLIETKIEQRPEDLEWQDIVDAIGLDVHRDSLRKAASVTPYSGYNVAQYYKKKYDLNNGVSIKTGDNYLLELDEKIATFRKESKKLSDQRREWNKILDTEGRKENLEQHLIEAANNLNNTIGRLDFGVHNALGKAVYNDKSEAVLVFSDWHYGMRVSNIWNDYDTKIFQTRLKNIVVKAVQKIELHKCRAMNIVVLGDMVHGAIKVSARVASEELVCEQLMEVSEILAQVVDYLSDYVELTRVYMVYGNHGRTVQNKNDSIHADNMERIIPWWLTQRLKDNKSVIVISEDYDDSYKDGAYDEIDWRDTCVGDGLVVFPVCGYQFCATHGDLDDIKTAGTTLSTLLRMEYSIPVDYILLGHKHHRESFDNLGITTMVCGSLCGTDDYANEKRLYSYPEQTMLIVTEEDGVDAEYHIVC